MVLSLYVLCLFFQLQNDEFADKGSTRLWQLFFCWYFFVHNQNDHSGCKGGHVVPPRAGSSDKKSKDYITKCFDFCYQFVKGLRHHCLHLVLQQEVASWRDMLCLLISSTSKPVRWGTENGLSPMHVLYSVLRAVSSSNLQLTNMVSSRCRGGVLLILSKVCFLLDELKPFQAHCLCLS